VARMEWYAADGRRETQNVFEQNMVARCIDYERDGELVSRHAEEAHV
jgi:hypothetical protein